MPIAAAPAGSGEPPIWMPKPPPSGRLLKAFTGLTDRDHHPVRAAALEQHRERQRAQQEDLADEEEPEQRRGDVDVVVAEDRRRPRSPMTARTSQLTFQLNHVLSALLAKYAKMPISEPSKTT